MTVNKMFVEGFKIEAIKGIKLKKISLLDGIDFLKSNFQFTYRVNKKNGDIYSKSIHVLSRIKKAPKQISCREIFFRNDEEFECNSIDFDFQNLNDQKIMLTFELI